MFIYKNLKVIRSMLLKNIIRKYLVIFIEVTLIKEDQNIITLHVLLI